MTSDRTVGKPCHNEGPFSIQQSIAATTCVSALPARLGGNFKIGDTISPDDIHFAFPDPDDVVKFSGLFARCDDVAPYLAPAALGEIELGVSLYVAIRSAQLAGPSVKDMLVPPA